MPRRRSNKATQMFGTLASVTRVMRAGQLRVSMRILRSMTYFITTVKVDVAALWYRCGV